MGTELLIMGGISLATSLLSMYLLKPENKSVARDDKPTTIATRGAPIPWLAGRRRVGVIFLWAGDRDVDHESGGGKGIGDTPDVDVYYEAGWHGIVCNGPAQALHRIIQDGTVIYGPPVSVEGVFGIEDPITPETHPSGTNIDLGREGNFDIYWGEQRQPVNTFLGDPSRVGISSRWPYLVYILWRKKRLGGSPRWGLLDYEMTVIPAAAGVPGVSPLIPETTPGARDDGLNPMHVVRTMLVESAPHGLGHGPDAVDDDAFAEVAQLLATEHFPCSVVAQGEETAEATIATVCQDAGVILANEAGRVRPVAVRDPVGTAIPHFTLESIADPLPEIDQKFDADPDATELMVFSFLDRTRSFREMTISLNDDGSADLKSFANARDVKLPTVIDFATANQAANRRAQEELAGRGTMRLRLMFEGRLLLPGQAFTADGMPLTMRVLEVATEKLDSVAEVSCVADWYGAPASDFVATRGIGQVPDGTPVLDEFFDFVEVPARKLTGPNVRIAVPRIRGGNQVTFSDIFASPDGVTYTQVKRSSTVQTGGTLDAQLVATTKVHVSGISFTEAGPDISRVVDLTGDDANWRRGRQLVVVRSTAGTEIMYLKKITALGGGQWTLDGVIRARLGTRRLTHPINTPIFIVLDDELESFEDILATPAANLFVKSRPAARGGSVPLSDVTAANHTVRGEGQVPTTPENFSTEWHPTRHNKNVWRVNEDVPFRWSYREDRNHGTGAGDQETGAQVARAPLVGAFQLQFLTTLNVVRRTVNITEQTLDPPNRYTYLNTDMDADFGADPTAFKARIKHIANGFESGVAEITITRVP